MKWTMKSFFPKPTFKVDDIISYAELVAAEMQTCKRE